MPSVPQDFNESLGPSTTIDMSFVAQRYDPLKRSSPFGVCLIGGVLSGPPQNVDSAPLETSTTCPCSGATDTNLARRRVVGPDFRKRQHGLDRQDGPVRQPFTAYIKKLKSKTAKGFKILSDWALRKVHLIFILLSISSLTFELANTSFLSLE
ncbi:hypothetical protein Ac2012v2_001312 [Leucoagaricus gongylophorus]